MEMSRLGEIHGSTINTDSLLTYLSQVVLSKIDDKIEKRQKHLSDAKLRLVESRSQLKEVKERLTQVSTEYERLKALYEVLQLIDNLKKEGILIGNNRAKISRLLYKIQDQNISTLKSLKLKLSVHLPEQYNRITIS